MSRDAPLNSKYVPLKKYLESSGLDRVSMKFKDMEGLLGFPLPASSRKHRAWWSNNPSNSVITYAWLNAGYETAEVDMASERLTFKRIRRPAMMPVKSPAKSASEKVYDETRFHPLYGVLKGALILAEDLDLTLPADPEWAERMENS